MTPFSAALCVELVVAAAIIIFAAILTNAGAIGAAVERLGWF